MSSHPPRSARSPFIRRLSISLAVGALALATAVVPAVASDRGDDDGQANWSQQGGNGYGNQQGGGNGNHDGGNQAGGNHGDRGKFKGVVTAHSPALRGSPHRGSHVIRYAHKGEVLSIRCKVGGDSVQGDSLWHLLTDGTWVWGPARHIDNIGPAPRWC